jgi:hypothetical protein
MVTEEAQELVDAAFAALDASLSTTELWAAFDAKARRQEQGYQNAAERLFSLEAVNVAKRLEASVSALKASDPLPTLADPYIEAALLRIAADYAPGGLYHTAWLTRYRELIAQTIRLGGRETAGQIGLSFNLDNPRAREAVLRRVTKLTGQVTQTTVDRIRDTVRAAMSEGVGVSEISRRIREQAFDGTVSRHRARTIARTESVAALNEGQHLAATDHNVLQSKRWLSQADGRVRDSHVDAANEGWIPLSSAFANGLQYPHDPSAPAEEAVNCRCTLLYSDLPPNEAAKR